jgi:hypothetical protein
MEMAANTSGNVFIVPVFHVHRNANKLIQGKIEKDNLKAMSVGNLDSDITVDIKDDCVIIKMLLPVLQQQFAPAAAIPVANENAALCMHFDTVLAALGTELHLIEIIVNDTATPNTFLGTACVAFSGKALLPWNGYVWEVPKEIEEGKTVIAPIEDSNNAIEISQACCAWNFLVHDFARQKIIADDARKILQAFSTNPNIERQPFTYLANFPGLFLVGDVITALTKATLTRGICEIYHNEVMRYMAPRQSEGNSSECMNFSTQYDLYCYLQLLQFSISCIYRQAGVSPYRLEQGEDQGPIFRPGVFGVRDDCEGLMTFFLDIFRSIQKHGLLQHCLQEDLMPLQYNGVFVEPGRVTYEKEIHACTLVLVVDHQGCPTLGVVENTCPVFFLESEAAAESWHAYLDKQLKETGDNTVASGHRDAQWFSCTTRKSASDKYEIGWFGACMVFTLEVSETTVQFTHGARPWEEYTHFIQCTQDVQLLESLLPKYASQQNTKTLMLLSPNIFFLSYSYLMQISKTPGKVPKITQLAHENLINYIMTATALSSKLTKVYEENAKVIWNFEQELQILMNNRVKRISGMQTDVRYLLSTPSQGPRRCGDENLLKVVKLRIYELCKLSEKARCILYNYVHQSRAGNPSCLCACFSQTLAAMLQIMGTFRQSWLWTLFKTPMHNLTAELHKIPSLVCDLELDTCILMRQILTDVSHACYSILYFQTLGFMVGRV